MWLVEGEEITEDAEFEFNNDGSAQLLLRDSTPEDQGLYTCIAENPLDKAMTSCRVTMEGRLCKK